MEDAINKTKELDLNNENDEVPDEEDGAPDVPNEEEGPPDMSDETGGRHEITVVPGTPESSIQSSQVIYLIFLPLQVLGCLSICLFVC